MLYHGSEYKDYVVWSAAADVAERLGADDAYATESHALCGGAPVAVRQVRARLEVGDVDRALLVAASREEDLIDYANEDSSFMFDFGSGASAAVLERADAVPPSAATTAGDRGTAVGQGAPPADEGSRPAGERARARVLESAAVTDGSFAGDGVMPAGGSLVPPSRETVEAGLHSLDVPDHESMKERLAEVSPPNFLAVGRRGPRDVGIRPRRRRLRRRRPREAVVPRGAPRRARPRPRGRVLPRGVRPRPERRPGARTRAGRRDGPSRATSSSSWRRAPATPGRRPCWSGWGDAVLE